MKDKEVFMNWLKKLLYMSVILVLGHVNLGYAGYRHSITNNSNFPIDVKEIVKWGPDSFSRNNVKPGDFGAWTTAGAYCIDGIDVYKAGKHSSKDPGWSWRWKGEYNKLWGAGTPCGNNNWTFDGSRITHYCDSGTNTEDCDYRKK